MKPAVSCSNLQEIREYIDDLDRSIIEILAARATYVQAASKFKASMEAVKARDRVTAMMAARRKWAEECGINPDFIQALFDGVVAFFIKGELTHWSREHSAGTGLVIKDAVYGDASTILGLQKRAFIQAAEQAGGDYNIAPIVQTLAEMRSEFGEYSVLKAVCDGLIVGSVRANSTGTICHIGRLVVEPIYQKRGYGTALMKEIESRFPAVQEYKLFTGATDNDSIRFYSRLGYCREDTFESPEGLRLVWMRKKNIP